MICVDLAIFEHCHSSPKDASSVRGRRPIESAGPFWARRTQASRVISSEIHPCPTHFQLVPLPSEGGKACSRHFRYPDLPRQCPLFFEICLPHSKNLGSILEDAGDPSSLTSLTWGRWLVYRARTFQLCRSFKRRCLDLARNTHFSFL